jgi:N-acetylneuraminic acid mutarotase
MHSLIELPEECILAILGWLPLPGLIACCAVSRELYRLAKDPSLWKGLFVEGCSSKDIVPDARLWCSSVIFKDKLYVYGGHTTQGVLSNLISNVKADFFCYDIATRKWSSIEHQMGGKTEHKCVVYDNALWLVGGYNGYDYTSDIHRFDPMTGTSSVVETTGESFSRRSALTALVWNDRMYTFGGWNGFSRTWYNDLHVFHFGTKHWSSISPSGKPPQKRTSHSAVIYKDKMYVFGGFSGDEYLNDLHEFDLEKETWTEITHLCKGDIPAPRSRFCAAVHGDCMYILGGWNKVGYFSDFYMFNFVTRVWTNITNSNFKVPSISQYSLASHKDFLYIFGGFCAEEKTCINKLYLYRLGTSNESNQSY